MNNQSSLTEQQQKIIAATLRRIRVCMRKSDKHRERQPSHVFVTEVKIDTRK